MPELSRPEAQTLLVSTFYLGDTIWGIDTMRVQEVIHLNEITNVPHAQDYIVGIVNLRGKIVTIIDLAKKLDLFQASLNQDSRIMIVDWQDEFIGFLVDGVLDVVNVEKEKLRPPSFNIKAASAKYTEGIYQSEQGLISILKVLEVLSEEA